MLQFPKRSDMSFFPALLNLKDKKIVVIGGGKIAADKVGHLLDFTNDITIVAPAIVDERLHDYIQEHNLRYIPRAYEEGDIHNFFIAIVAVDDIALQKRIYEECQEHKVLCNAVDSVEYCDFIFPSYIKEGDLVVAFSTSGASPALSKYLRRAIQKLLPADIAQFLQKLKSLRSSLPKGKERMQLLDSKAKEYIQKHFKDL